MSLSQDASALVTSGRGSRFHFGRGRGHDSRGGCGCDRGCGDHYLCLLWEK